MQKISNILNDDLADEYVLLTKTRNYHWNVEDPRFNDLHKFFEEQYELISAAVDEVAERVRAVGGRTRATLKEFINSSQIREDLGTYPNADTMLGNLLSDCNLKMSWYLFKFCNVILHIGINHYLKLLAVNKFYT